MARLTKPMLEAIAAALDAALAGDGFDGGDFDGMDQRHFERAREWTSEQTAPDRTTIKVKPLEWQRVAKPESEDQYDEAETPFGGYVITADPFSYSPTPAYYVDGPDWFKGQFPSVGEAKAAAQVDFETRILSALEAE